MLEGEVLNTLEELGEGQMKLEMAGVTVSPQQFLGIEVNPRAAAIAELVLWIGHLQWHYRTRGNAPHAEPIIKDFHNIECRDAVLAWEHVEPLLDENGQPVTRWDGRSTKPHPVTGEQVPDETARIPAYRYLNPRPATWPDADFVVGNPPFIGIARMREALGDGYTESLRKTYKELPDSVDYVMYWWQKAAELVRNKKVEVFGLITTNSLRQIFNRRVIEKQLNSEKPLSIIFAIPDHPWVDAADGAAVRIAMTVGVPGQKMGRLVQVEEERWIEDDTAHLEVKEQIGNISADLTIGVDVTKAKPLQANGTLSNKGMMLFGKGFILTLDQAEKLGLGQIEGLEKHIRPFIRGKDLAGKFRQFFVIDFFGLSSEEVRKRFPAAYQWLFERVKPERDQNNRESYRRNWWLFGEPRASFRPVLDGLERFIATPRTAKHRFFTFLPKEAIAESEIIIVAIDDWFHLGVLSSRIHVLWALSSGTILGPTPRYNNTRCFEPFPFPDASEAQKARIRTLAEQLDAHRKRQQAQHPSLTLTDMYNVLQKTSEVSETSEVFSAKEKQIYEQGLIAILKQLHDDLDTAVFAAYGWPSTLTDEEILQHLVDLNAERAAEEANGRVRWLRPAYQAPDAVKPQQATLLDVTATDTVGSQHAATLQIDWPKALKDRATAVRTILAGFGGPVSVAEVAGGFNGRSTQKRLQEVGEILEMLAELGQIVENQGKFVTSQT